MSRLLMLLPAIVLMVAACNQDPDARAPGAPPPELLLKNKKDPPPPPPAPEATGFMTANVVPEAAEDSRNDGIFRDSYGRPFNYPLLNQAIPEFTARMVNGETVDDSVFDGYWTVLDVWGLWCSDCMADAPYAEALSRAVDQDSGLQFLSLHVPPSATRLDETYGKYGSVETYFEAQGYSYPTLLDEDASLRDALQIPWTPSYLLIDPEGVVRGYRSDFSAASGEPVKDFLADVAKVKASAALGELPPVTVDQDG